MSEPNPLSLPQRLIKLKQRTSAPGAPIPPPGEHGEPSPVRPLDEVLSSDLGLEPRVITQIMETPEEERLAMLTDIMPQRLKEAAGIMTPAERLALHQRFKALTERLTVEPVPAASTAQPSVVDTPPARTRRKPGFTRIPNRSAAGETREASEGAVDQVIYPLFWSAGINYSEVAGITDRAQLQELIRQKREGQVQNALRLKSETGEDNTEAIANITLGFGMLNMLAETVSLPIGPLPRTVINSLLVEIGVAPEKLIGQPSEQIVQRISEELVASAGQDTDTLKKSVNHLIQLAGLQENGFFSWSDLSNPTGSTPHAVEHPPTPATPAVRGTAAETPVTELAAGAESDGSTIPLERELSDYGLFRVLGYSTRVPFVGGAADINHVLQMYRVANENLDSKVTAALEADPHDPDALARRDAYARVRAEINRRFPDDASLLAELQRVPVLGDELPAAELLARLKLNPGDLRDEDLATPFAINLALQNQVRRIGHEVDAAIRANPLNLIPHELVDEQIDAFESLMKKYNADPAAFTAEIRGTPEAAPAAAQPDSDRAILPSAFVNMSETTLLKELSLDSSVYSSTADLNKLHMINNALQSSNPRSNWDGLPTPERLAYMKARKVAIELRRRILEAGSPPVIPPLPEHPRQLPGAATYVIIEHGLGLSPNALEGKNEGDIEDLLYHALLAKLPKRGTNGIITDAAYWDYEKAESGYGVVMRRLLSGRL